MEYEVLEYVQLCLSACVSGGGTGDGRCKDTGI